MLGAGVNFWEFCRSPKVQNNRLISCRRKKMMKTRGGLCNTSFIQMPHCH